MQNAVCQTSGPLKTKAEQSCASAWHLDTNALSSIAWHTGHVLRHIRFLQVVCAHPLASHSAQLQHLIAEAVAAQQGSQDLSPISQVHNLYSATPSSSVARALVTHCQDAQHVLLGDQLHVSLHVSLHASQFNAVLWCCWHVVTYRIPQFLHTYAGANADGPCLCRVQAAYPRNRSRHASNVAAVPAAASLCMPGAHVHV